MGYQIPGADFTSPTQLKTNVGAQVGQSLGTMLAQFGKALQLSNAQAKKTEALQDQAKDTILITNGKAVAKTVEAGKAQYGQDTVLYDDWSKEIIRRGDEATQAQIDFQFGDLNADEKKEKLGIVTSFDTYLQSSQTDMGRFIADVTDRDKDGMRIIGDTTNGEQQLNQYILTANGGGSAESNFGAGATMVRALSGPNKKSIDTTVRIPEDSDFFATLNGKSGGTSSSVFDKGITEGVEGLKKVEIDGKFFYEFKKTIDTGTYSTPGGSDFVIQKSKAINAGETIQELGFVNKDMIIEPKMFAQMNVGGGEETVDGANVNPSTGEPAVYTSSSTKNSQKGFVKTTNSSIINAAEMRNDPALGVKVRSEVKGILLNGRSVEAKLDSFGAYGVVSLDNWPKLKEKHKTLRNFLESGDDDQVKTFTNTMVTQNIFDETFSKTDGKGNRVYTQMTADPKMVKFLNDNNIMNEANEPYEVDQTVYVKNEIIEREIKKDSGPSFDDQLVKTLSNENMTDDELINVFSVPVLIPGPAKSKVASFPNAKPPGVYRIDKDGDIASGATPLSRKVLRDLFPNKN